MLTLFVVILTRIVEFRPQTYIVSLEERRTVIELMEAMEAL